jgi:circadian clock protein KaiB
MTAGHDAAVARLEAALAERQAARYEFTLIVSGASDLSARAITNARELCDKHLAGRYHLSVVDLHEEPGSIPGGQILAAPTLVKTQPLPMRKFVGDLSRTEKVLLALNLPSTQPLEPQETGSI